MKPFFGTDVTENKKNEVVNGDEFLVQKPSPALTEAFQRSSQNTYETLQKTKMPLPFRAAQWLFGAVAFVLAIGILKSMEGEDGISITTAYQNAAWVFWLGGACFILWLIFTFISHRKHKNTIESDESNQVFSDFNSICDSIMSDLGVPTDAKEVDILSFLYKVKGDKIKVREKGWQVAPYNTSIVHAYSDSDNLYLTNLDGKYAFPLSSLVAIKTVKKIIRFDEWNKDTPCNEGEYKQYKLSEDQYGCIICRNYHILEVEHNGEIFGIYFPCYELPVFEQLTGLTATENT